MGLTQYISAPLRYRPWRVRHARLILRDLTGSKGVAQSHETHVRGLIDWLCLAQDARNGYSDAGGVSAGWSFEDGWLPSYPETTGYIIETFLAAAKYLDRPELVTRATRMIDWELSLQQADGAFPGHFGEAGSHPVIFNQGQIMHGMVAGYLQLHREDCMAAAVRGGHWLVRHQDPDGCWRQFEHNAVPHTYNTRAAWALLATGLAANETKLVQSAIRNLDWALSQQAENGWFGHCAFTPDRDPFTHTIAYAIRGLLECGVLLGEERYLHAASRAASQVARVQRSDGWLAGTFGSEWRPSAHYACLTGIAQMGLNWLRLSQEKIDSSLREHARRGIGYLKTRHRIQDNDLLVCGALAGSFPIWGAYSRFEFPNWAAKFFADALMMDALGSPIPPVTKQASSVVPMIAHV